MQSNDDIDGAASNRICASCVGESFLSAEIQSTGVDAECSYCKRSGQSWTIEELADRIETAFDDHYNRTADYPDSWQERLQADSESSYVWEREGQPVLEAIEEAAEIPSEAAEDVLEILADKYASSPSDYSGEEDEFDPDSYYELKGADDRVWQLEWRHFEQSLKTEARYFSRSAAAHLAAVFGSIDKLRARDGNQLVVDAGPETAFQHLYRARVFQSNGDLIEALCRPDRGLAPPPARSATAGRMNAKGIAVFYGAEEPAVALAEVRPPVGSRVAVARFRIVRPLRLLDLSAISDAHDVGSIFDPSLKDRLERVAFLQSLGARISRPVMPDDEDFDYLATQAVADFLATDNEPRLDGIIFTSAQHRGGRNIVLFHSAARVAAMELPVDTEVSANCGYHDEDGWQVEYWVWEEVPADSAPAPLKRPGLGEEFGGLFSPFALAADGDIRIETLRVIPESVEVHHIDRIRVETTAYPVERHRHEKRRNQHDR